MPLILIETVPISGGMGPDFFLYIWCCNPIAMCYPTVKPSFMRCYFYLAIGFLTCIPWHSRAQITEFPYSTLPLHDLTAFKSDGDNWKIAGDVFYDLRGNSKGKITGGKGVLVNDLSGKSKDHLFTKMEHGDIDLELEFMMDKGSNSGIFLQGRYEIQMFDSWGVDRMKVTDCGAIYERWDESRPEGRKGYEGHPPSQNVTRAPGLWQHYRIQFRAPRFNSRGEKVQNARFIKVVHNGVVIHENVELTGPTRASAFSDEKPLGPLMIQGDHGPVALRNISYKAYGTDRVTLSDLKLTAYEGRYASLRQMDTARATAEMNVDVLKHQGTETNDYYAGKITGTISTPVAGPYYFNLNLKWIPEDTNPDNPNGGGELRIGNKRLITLDGTETGTASVITHLEAGQHPIELLYYKKFGHWYQPANDIVLGVETPGIAYENLNAELLFAEAVGAITVPVDTEPVMVRSFVNHNGEKKTHALSVGEPGSVNYSYDLASGSLLQCWRGDFLETTLMWHGRGEPQVGQPLGSVIEFPGRPTVALLGDPNVVWPDSNATYSYTGYNISQTGHPEIRYSIGQTELRETFRAEASGNQLTRTVTVVSADATDLWCLVAEGSNIEKMPNGLYAINDKQYFIELPDKRKPVIRRGDRNEMEILLPLNTKDGNGIQYSIIW
jgi:hypothetical protein